MLMPSSVKIIYLTYTSDVHEIDVLSLNTENLFFFFKSFVKPPFDPPV